jgi:hypothetical protein
MSEEAAGPSNEQIIDAFQKYLDERAADGVLYAKAVVSVIFDGSTVLAKFDPSAVGATEETFLFANPYDTLAEFVGTPVAFADGEGKRLRSRVERVRATFSDGRDLGSMTAAELFRKGTGTEWRVGL